MVEITSTQRSRLYVRWWWLAAGFLAALAAGWLAGWWMERGPGWTHGVLWERVLLLQLREHPLVGTLDRIVLWVPWLGTNWTLGPLVIGAALILWRRYGRGKLAAHLVTVLVGSSALNFTLKFFFDRPRPDLWEKRGQWQYASYPSGHAIASVAVLLTVAMLLHRSRGWRWPYYVAVLVLGVSLYSRLYLGVHWPTDVAVGYLMGTLWLAGTMIAFTDRRSQPADPALGPGAPPVGGGVGTPADRRE